MLSDVHTFKVWHPAQRGLPKHEEKDFHFSYPVSRMYARDIVERVEGYVIEKKRGKRRGITQRRVKNKVQKIS